MTEVTLQQILQAREDRALLQKRLLREHSCPLICFTMNIAGPVKTSALIQWGFQAGLESLLTALPVPTRHHQVRFTPTGCEGYISVPLPAIELKQLCTEIEEATPLGRLFDMDVIDVDSKKLQRTVERACLICGKPGRTCAARRLHPAKELQAVTEQILVSELAVQSLLREADTTPKPGLVDRRNNGSHKDMCLQTFISSANALRPYFAQCAAIGQQTAQLSPADTFQLLRQAGIQAESTMLETTGGVNTHKGAIFTLGILCGSIGRLGSYKTDDILLQVSLMGKVAEQDFVHADGSTAGERLYLQKHLRGIRGEVADGLPSVTNIGLPAYKNGLRKGLAPNHAGVVALLHLIANVKDTNLHHRGGSDGADWATKSAQALLQTAAHPPIPPVEALDDAFIARNLSPGGCADLLAATYFLHSLNP